MIIRILGEAARFRDFTFAVRDEMILTVQNGVARTEPPVGLASAIVAELLGTGQSQESERVFLVDQTNHSVVVGEKWVVKFIARWGTADRSAHLERALAEASSRDVPRFLGSVEWEHASRGASTIALVSEYLPNSTDGWTWAANDVIEQLGNGDPTWPADVGALVARVHTDLANGTFPPGSDDRLQAHGLEELVASLTSLYEARTDAAASRIRARIARIAAAAARLPADWDPPRIVPHGDLHVGQVIRDATGRYALLDFDGDPQWERARRFQRQPVERDVAHMLNSIDLVAAVAQKRLQRVDADVWAWADRAQQQFLAAYADERKARGGTVPLNDAALVAFRAEQLLFELRYAARYLPEWEYAPDAAMSWRYPTHDPEETPWTPPAL